MGGKKTETATGEKSAACPNPKRMRKKKKRRRGSADELDPKKRHRKFPPYLHQATLLPLVLRSHRRGAGNLDSHTSPESSWSKRKEDGSGRLRAGRRKEMLKRLSRYDCCWISQIIIMIEQKGFESAITLTSKGVYFQLEEKLSQGPARSHQFKQRSSEKTLGCR